MKKMRPTMIWVTVVLAILLPLITSYIYSSFQDLSFDSVACDSTFSFMNSECKDSAIEKDPSQSQQSLGNDATGQTGSLADSISGAKTGDLSVSIYFGDKSGRKMSEIFGGEQEIGHYYLWMKNTGSSDAICTFTSNKQDTATEIITSKEMFMTVLKSGQNSTRLFAFDGFDYSIDDLAPEIRCEDGGGKIIVEKPSIQKFYWKRFQVLDGDYKNPQDTAKTIIIGSSIDVVKSGSTYNFIAVENAQNEDCTIKYNDQRYKLQPYTTQKISDFKVTLVESGFKYCSILFW